MLVKLIIGVVVVIFLILLVKYFTGKGKPSNQRTTLEKLACTIFSIFKGHVKDATNTIRTATVMKQEAMQELDEAVRKLEESYAKGQTEMRTALKNLQDDVLPNLKDKPGMLEGKARNNKKLYQESVNKGTPIEAYKQNAIRFIQMKLKASENIKRTEKNIEKLKVAIDTGKAQYEGQKVEFDLMKSELAAMVEIPRAELDSSLNRIDSLRGEITQKLNKDNIQAEVSEEMRNETNYSADAEEEFNNL